MSPWSENGTRWMSWSFSGPEFRVVWLCKRLDSEWKPLWASCSFVPWLVLNAFWDVTGAVPEWPWIRAFIGKSSRRDNAPNVRFSVLLNSWDNFFWLCSQFFPKLELRSLLMIWEHSSFCQIAPNMFLTIFLFQCCNFSPIPQSCTFLQKINYQWIIIECLLLKANSICCFTVYE